MAKLVLLITQGVGRQFGIDHATHELTTNHNWVDLLLLALVRRAVLFAALEQIAKHHASRDLLVDDSKAKVDLTINGSFKSFEGKAG